MEAKRKILFIVAIIGMIGTFLPWARFGPFSISGAKGDGWFTFAFFLIAAVVLFKGDRSAPVTAGTKTMVSIMGILGFIFGLWKIIRFSDASAMGASLGLGLWVVTLAGAAIIYLNFFKKDKAAVGAPAKPVIAAGPAPAPVPEPVITPPAPAAPAYTAPAAPAAPVEEEPEETEPEL